MADSFYPFKRFRTNQSVASSGLTARCVPQPKITVTFSSFTPARFNSASTGKSIASLGALRVASSTTMATLLSGLAISLKRFEPTGMGSFRARSTSALASVRLGAQRARLCRGGFGLELGRKRRFFRREAKHQPCHVT